MPITVVFSNQNGFVTELVDENCNVLTVRVDGNPVGSLPRYGVWSPDPAKGKPQVVATSNDLEWCIGELQADACKNCGNRTFFEVSDGMINVLRCDRCGSNKGTRQ